MLVLARKRGETVVLDCGDEETVTVTVTEIGQNVVRLGIDAPQDVRITREPR